MVIRAVTLTWPRPLPSLESDFAAIAFAPLVAKRSLRGRGEVASNTLTNDEFAFLNATFDSAELVPFCRNLVYGPGTITETTLDFFLELVPYCEQLFQLPHLGPLRAPRSLCQRFHVPSTTPIFTSPSGMVQIWHPARSLSPGGLFW